MENKATSNTSKEIVDKKKINRRHKVAFFRFIWTYYKMYWVSTLMLIISTILSCGITIIIPKLANIIFNELVFSESGNNLFSWNVLTYWIIGLCIAILWTGIFLFLQYLFGGRLANKIEIEVRIKVFNKLLSMDVGFFRKEKIGDVLTKLIFDTKAIGQQATSIPLTILNNFLTFIGSAIVLFTFDNIVLTNSGTSSAITHNYRIEAQISAIILACIVLVLVITVSLFVFLRKTIDKQKNVLSKINGDVVNRLQVIDLIKTADTTAYEQKHINRMHRRYRKVSNKVNMYQSLITATMISTFSALNVVVIVIGIVYMSRNQIDPSIMISFTLSVNTLIGPFLQLIRTLSDWAAVSASTQRVTEILVYQPKIIYPENGVKIDTIKNSISLEKVTFGYPGSKEDILNEFSYKFKVNHRYAIVGETGSGKTTIFNLILRLYDPELGNVVIDDIYDLKTVDMHSYLKLIGYVEQEPRMIYGTIFENIAYGFSDCPLAKVKAAAEQAAINNFIESLPDKYDTVVGEHGYTLSGGQRQRIVLARMFLRNPEIILLDEATSSLDGVVEQEVQEALDKLLKGRLTIIIAHRLATIKNVDEIIVISKGKGMVQHGTFEKLKRTKGLFKTLYEAGLIE